MNPLSIDSCLVLVTSAAPLQELWHSVVLGVVQGLTEFLPISSSAHLILFSKVAGWPDQGLAFDIAANTGTLAALLAYFWRDLVAIVRRGLRSTPAAATGIGETAGLNTSSGASSRRQWSLLVWLAVATIPVAVAGLLAADWIAREGRNPTLIATTSIVFGVLLWIADRRVRRGAEAETDTDTDTEAGEGGGLRSLSEQGATLTNGPRLGLRDALAMGVAQAIALIPGTSRSGAVMTAGLFRDFDRASAARLAFLMAIPVGVLVAIKNAMDLLGSPTPVAWDAMLVGFFAAAISGYLVITLLLEWLKRRGLGIFVIYRIALGVVLLLLGTT